MDDYEKLLDRAKEKLPERQDAHKRFSIPKVKGHIEGNKTVVSNFGTIAQTFNRNPKHMLKFILKEMATPGELFAKGVVFKSKVSANKLNDKIGLYADQFVFCKECSSPDTTMKKEGFNHFIRCQACGARYSVFAKL